jgi:hypothetical protein
MAEAVQDPGGHVQAADTAIAPTPTLLGLPPEMFELVARSAEPKDLLAMRLIDREARDKTQRTFEQVYFTYRAFLLSSEESLRTLFKISSHNIFGRTLREVSLCVEQIDDQDY